MMFRDVREDPPAYQVQVIIINTSPTIYVTWDFVLQRVYITKKEEFKAVDQTIPWFEPDLTNYNKLINKVKTYLVFS